MTVLGALASTPGRPLLPLDKDLHGCRLCAEVPADVNSRDAGLEEMPNRVASGIVGGSDIYLSAPSPGGDQSERATYILYIAIIPLNDFLSAVTHSQP